MMHWLAAGAWSRAWLNRAYLAYSPAQRQHFYEYYAKIYTHRPAATYERTAGSERSATADERAAASASAGVWRVQFNGVPLVMPLTRARRWLDWDLALAIVGHDLEVKQTYAALLNSPLRPELFVDIGANYGTHSLLFLSQGVSALSFEPNPACHPYLREICRLNGVTPRLEPVALGERAGQVTLAYPPGRTWLGAVLPDSGGAAPDAWLRAAVEQKTLDAYVPALLGRRLPLKIDVEGAELAVLRGAAATLSQLRPLVIFESQPGSARDALFGWLAERGYRIHHLPWAPAGADEAVSAADFRASPAMNFIALPQGSQM